MKHEPCKLNAADVWFYISIAAISVMVNMALRRTLK